VARGNGLAPTVTEEGWRLFNERIQQSQSILERAEKLPKLCPQWYSEMMIVGLAQSWDAGRMKDIFDRGIRSEPDYFYLYRQYANYLLPKWDGKPAMRRLSPKLPRIIWAVMRAMSFIFRLQPCSSAVATAIFRCMR